VPTIYFLLAINLLLILYFLPAITVSSLLFLSRLIVLVEVGRVEEVGSSEAVSSGR